MEDFHKYPKILIVGHDENKEIFTDPEDWIVIEEKIDGGNFRFIIKDDKVIFGSRTQQITDDEGEYSNVAKNFKSCCDYIKSKIEFAKEQWKLENLKDYEGLIFYGEACHKHTLSYDWQKIPRFLGFDVMDKEGKFLSMLKAKTIFEDFDIKFVPVIAVVKGEALDKIDDNLVPTSTYAPLGNPNQKAEGIVFKNYKKQIFAKYVRDEFKEENATAFGGNPKYNKEGDYDNDEFVFKYCTNARIDKIIFKLIDEGKELGLPLMHLLPKQVYLDIWEEHWQDIRDSNWKLDLKGLRVTIPKRCLSILKMVIVNNAR